MTATLGESIRYAADIIFATLWYSAEWAGVQLRSYLTLLAIKIADKLGYKLPAIITQQEQDLNGQVVLITGGASGIGRIMSERFAIDEHCKVAIWDISEPLLAKTRSEIEQLSVAAGSKAGNVVVKTYRVDVTDRDAVYAAAKKVEQELGPVTVLISNAGIVDAKPFLEMQDELVERTMKVNCLAGVWVTKAFLPKMIELNKGNIVFVSSATALAAVNGMADYSSSKSAAFGLAESIRLEIKDQGHNITTTTVCPYFIETGMFHGVKTKWPRLLPILKPEYVAEQIVQAVKTNKELLVLPSFAYISYFFRLVCPTWMVDGVCKFLGVTDSLKTFQGKKPEERHKDLHNGQQHVQHEAKGKGKKTQ